jgi:nitrogen regulatory protein PII
MKPIKKIEIIFDSVELDKIIALIEKQRIFKYTVIRDVTGRGDSGIQSGDDLTDVFKNTYMMVACSEEQMHDILNAIQPVLKKYGGLCLVSDVFSAAD